MPPSLPERYNGSMAKKFLTPINITNLSSDPGSAIDGDIYYNIVSDKLRVYANSTWVDVSGGGGSGVTSITGTANQIDVSASTGAVTISLPNTAVTPTSYGSASAVGTFTVDSKGRLTAASNVAIAIAQSAVTDLTTDLAAKAPLASPTFTGTVSASAINISIADTSTAASHYIVETGSDGVLRPKTLANVQSEVVTNTVIQNTTVSPTSAGSKGVRQITMSTSTPTGGSDGDVWLVYT